MTNQPTNNSPSRRLTTLMLAIALMGAGCGPGAGSGTVIVDNFPKEKITLTLWRVADDTAGFADAVNEYTQIHNNVSFNFKVVSPTTYEKELIEALAAGKGPDIVTLPNDKIHEFEDKLAPMPNNFFGGSEPVGVLTARYPQAVVTDTFHAGKVFGIPFGINALVLIWNNNLVQKEFNRRIQENLPAGEFFLRAPIDWTEVIELSKALTKRSGDRFDQSGIALGTTNNIPHASDIIAALMLQQGVKMVTADGNNAAYHLPDPNDSTYYPGAAVLDFLHGFSDPASDHYSWNARQPDAVQQFIDGKLGMMINYPSIVPYLVQRNPGLSVNLAPFPQISNARTIVDFAGDYRIEAVNKASKYPQVAWDFLAKMVDIGLPLYLEITGQTSALKQFAPTTTVAERAYRTDVPLLEIATARSWFKGPDATQADLLLSQSLDRVIGQGQNPRDSLAGAAAAFTQLLSTSSP